MWDSSNLILIWNLLSDLNDSSENLTQSNRPHTESLTQNFQVIQPNCYVLVYEVFNNRLCTQNFSDFNLFCCSPK